MSHCSQTYACGLQKKVGGKKYELQARRGIDTGSKVVRMRAVRPEYRGSTPDGARGSSLHRVQTGPGGNLHLFLSTG